MESNPLLQHWETPYGLPPFDRIRPEHFKPALDTAMSRHREEIETIAGDSAPATFENTVAALDRSGEAMRSVALLFSNLTASETSDELQAVERELAPVIASHRNWITLHKGLFARIDRLYAERHNLQLGAEQLRLLERLHLQFVRAGAQLKGEDRTRFAGITEELASLYTDFSQAVLADEAEFTLRLETEADRAGLPEFVLDAAASVAAEKGFDGYAFNLSPSLVDPFLTYSTRRDLREKVWKAYKARGQANPERDTRPTAARIVQLRAELARIMGYATYAEYALDDRMAKTPAAVLELLEKVWEPAKARAAEEQKHLEDAARTAGAPGTIEGWDWHFWAERVRRERYNLDESELKPYFQLDRMLEAMFECANRLYGIVFTEVHDVPLYHPDVRLFEVREEASGGIVGIYISDNFARATKRGGAWMSEYREQARNRDGYRYPIIANNNNFAKAANGRPTLLSFDNVRTLFHEFGHALHGLLSDVTYVRLSGTNVLRDFVELPSQMHENWAFEPGVLKKHARHAETGEPISDELIERIRAARQFNQGFRTVEYTACALVDMALHGARAAGDSQGLHGARGADTSQGLHGAPATDTSQGRAGREETAGDATAVDRARAADTPPAPDIAAFEKSECRRLGVPPAIGLRHRLSHFRHLFSTSGYAAGYYVYMWAEVLEADAFEAFIDSGDVFSRDLASRFRECVLSAGDSVDPAEAYRCFRGRDPRLEPMLRKRGLIAGE